jgi:hypothetical protein
VDFFALPIAGQFKQPARSIEILFRKFIHKYLQYQDLTFQREVDCPRSNSSRHALLSVISGSALNFHQLENSIATCFLNFNLIFLISPWLKYSCPGICIKEIDHG